MKGLYVVSTDEYSGKSAVSLSLALMLKEKKTSVAYMKPIGTQPTKVEGRDSCEDVDFIWTTLGKPGAIEDVCPIVLLADFVDKVFTKRRPDYKKIILQAAERLSKNHDALILEGAAHLNQGKFIGLSALDIANLLDVPALLIAKYTNLLTVDEVLTARELLGEHLLGVIINMVPHSETETVEKIVIPFLKKQGLNIMGFLPKDKMLSSISIKEIAEYLKGQVLCAEDKVDELVETFMVGAMGQEQAISYFRKRANKAVITGGDRPDVQLAALETPTKCLILTGNLNPRPLVLSRAEELGIPVILVHLDTLTTVEKTEELIGRVRIHESKKIEHIKQLIQKKLKLGPIIKAVTSNQ